MNKEKIKGMVIGFVLCLTLSASVFVAANTGGVMREVFYGVNITVNGEPWNPPADMTPFISGGRTFIPVRGIAELFDVPIDWYGPTSTVYIGTIPRGMPFLQAAPWFERSSNTSSLTVNIQGSAFPNAISRGSLLHGSVWSNHNLNGQFSTLTGTIGRVDGSGGGARTISFIGDGRTLATFSVDGTTMPTDINVDVRGVLILNIQIQTQGNGGARIAFANAMIE